MITIEPIMKFDLEILVEWVQLLKPIWVWVGYDTKNTGLPEPTLKETYELIDKLKHITIVKTKYLKPIEKTIERFL